jgi:predicted amidohydrolase YtcJ
MSDAADLLITGGRVFEAYRPSDLVPYGSDIGPRPIAAPNAIAIRDGQIAWLGRDDAAVRDWLGPRTEHVDARGGLITAGFDDAHIHLLSGARALDQVDLFGLASVEAIQAAIARHDRDDASSPWVLGRGWLYAPFPGGLPTRDLLEAVVADRPAFLSCYDGHTAWVNAAALRAAGIDRDTPDPAHGAIVRDPATGEPTGVLKESAQDLVTRVIPTPGTDETLAALRRAIAGLHASGITAIQDAGIEVEELPLWRSLLDEGTLRLRARVALPMRPERSLDAWRETLDGYEGLIADLRGGPWLEAGILKAYADGVVEARTAALLEPYIDDTGSGHLEWDPDVLDAYTAEADRRGWQIQVHAIGDAAIRTVLDSYERAAAANPERDRDRRHRVEHIETITRRDIPRFAALGVVASMQPFHADPSPNQTEVWARNLGPERAGQAWSWASIRREGAVVALGSDWPVVPFDPFLALNAAVNRQTVDGQPAGGWLPSEKLSLPDALAAYGHGSAFAAFAERRRGTLRAGADADLVVLDRDILAGGPSSIIGTTVTMTVVGGQVVHRSEALR